MKQPCKKDCPDRSGTCHAVCEKYLDFAAWCEERRKHNQKQGTVFVYIKDSVETNRRKR